MTKFWCTLGTIRCQITLADCRACDTRAGFPIGAFEECTARRFYEMQIVEAYHRTKWYLCLLWKSPQFFFVLLGKTLANLMGLSATPMADKEGWHLVWIRQKKKGASSE